MNPYEENHVEVNPRVVDTDDADKVSPNGANSTKVGTDKASPDEVDDDKANPEK